MKPLEASVPRFVRRPERKYALFIPDMAIFMHPQVFFIVVHQSVVMTLAILGNLFLIFVIFRGNHVSRRRISPVQLLLLHTCVADLLFALLSLGTEILTMVRFIFPCILCYITDAISYPHFLGPDWICKAMRYGQMFPLYASSFLLVAISADRYQVRSNLCVGKK
uniref:G_PROTEIN_RECEP_F1_2 domain-containing protein n=1 Tax=Heterorhabditis bacteriophora TaxID=37862 RepID=A0A1I7WPW5_HETBA